MRNNFVIERPQNNSSLTTRLTVRKSLRISWASARQVYLLALGLANATSVLSSIPNGRSKIFEFVFLPWTRKGAILQDLLYRLKGKNIEHSLWRLLKSALSSSD